MKPVFVISILIVGIISFMGGRMLIAPKLKIAQKMVTQLEAEKRQKEEKEMKDNLQEVDPWMQSKFSNSAEAVRRMNLALK